MGVHCPCLGAPYPTVRPIPLYHGTGGTVHGSTLSHLRAPYPIVYPIPLYHGTGGTVHGNPLSHLRAPYSTVLSEPLYVLFLSHSSPKYTVHYGSSLVSKSSVRKNVLPVSPGSTRLSTKSAMSKLPNSIVVKFDSMYPNCPQN